MSQAIATKTVKTIKVDLDKCMGCRACEMACSGLHASPKYSSFNPARSRIRVVLDVVNDVYVPIRGGDYAPAECSGRQTFTIKGKEYSQCSFCSVSCPSRDLFREPDSALPLKCDMCGCDPSLKEPLCVQVCRPGALTYVESEAPVDEPTGAEMETGLESLIKKHGLQKVRESISRMSPP
jgi:benzoyl-CoA reductase subunit BamC